MKKIVLSIITASLFMHGNATEASNTVKNSKNNASTTNTQIGTANSVHGVTLNVPQCANNSACYLVYNTSTHVLSAINQDIPQSQVQSLIQTAIIPQFDFNLITRYALGNNWKLANPEQQTQLVDLFKQLLIYTYSSALSKFKNSSIVIIKSTEDTKKASVITEVKFTNNNTQNSNQPIYVEYNLAKINNDSWKVYDVKIENVSLITTYRNQFNEVVQRSKIDGLIKQLQTKVSTLKENKG